MSARSVSIEIPKHSKTYIWTQSMLKPIARCVVLFATLAAFSATHSNVATAAPEKEADLLAVLRSDAAGAEKAMACKKLAIYGSAAAVDDLGNLLPDPQLSSWARIALEVIPGEEPNAALRQAATTLEGRLLVGVINSLSFRGDAGAVDTLITKLKDSDTEVASAAAVALGNIGTPAAVTSLRAALADSSNDLKSAVAEGCVLCAERLNAAGDAKAAIEIYDEVRNADLPMQRIIEATRGAILARQQDGISLLMEAFQSPDKKMFRLALSTVREFPGAEVDKVLASKLTDTTPERAAMMIQAMADRPDTVSLAVILKSAQTGDQTIRLSAINALQRVGNDSCLATLLEIATDADEDLAAAAQQTLAVLPGTNVNNEISTLLPKASGDQYRVLLQLIGKRRISAVPEVQKALGNSDAAIRGAALSALGQTVSLKQMAVLVSCVVRPEHAEDLPIATRALKTASVRMPDREACAGELAAALTGSPAAAKVTLLEIVTEVGGPTALKTLATAAKSSDPQMQDTGSRLLGTWNNVAAAPVLLDLAKTGPAEKYRVRALRGYLGLARKFAMPDKARAEMCQNAFNATRRIAEHELGLDVLKLHPSAAGLKLAIKSMKSPALKTHATATAMSIAQKIGGKGKGKGKGVDVAALLSAAGLAKVKLEITKATYGSGPKQKDVTNILRKQASDSPLITLPATYNTSFGGDPAPGTVKVLTIQYRLNGKAAEATFAENAAILLTEQN